MERGAPEELLQVLEEDGGPTGQTMSAADVHAAGCWHGAVVVWVLRPDGHVLLRRDVAGDACAPLKLGPSARAHRVSGVPASAGAIDALERQLSVDARRHGLTHLGTFRVERRCGPVLDRELQDVFAAYDERPLEDLVLDPLVADTVYEVPLQKAIALFESGAIVPAPGFDSMQRVSNALLYEEDLPGAGREAVLEQLRALDAWSAASEVLEGA